MGNLLDAIFNAVIGKVGEVAAEGICFDGIGPRLKVSAVNVGQDIGAGDVENFVASLEPVEICIQVKVDGLKLRPHGSVTDQHPVMEGLEKLGFRRIQRLTLIIHR